jgi:phosphorylase kinase alpha/beta subunit
MNAENNDFLLDEYFNSIEKIILSRQDPITGLLPASTAITAHGDYTDAWVRDNVYSILCVWGLSLSYKKYDPDHFRTYYLGQSVVKLMRGLLLSMMRQADKVEKFKYTLNPTDALHAKYGTKTGLPVVGDDEWGHLQLDATSIFILMLAQMIASGLKIVYSIDEVNFVQNLVHYISRTYCTPDFGIWERGHKINTGNAEINCSSVGMAKAALEAINGFNLFGNVSSKESIIHVIPSDVARSRFTLYNLLPRESSSKETDAALLSIIGFPAYAIEDKQIVKKTKDKILKKLVGNYGCKRFLLDGHQSFLEDHTRLHYEVDELREFENIESEWPLFFTYLLLDSLMQGNKEEAKLWREKLEPLFVEVDGVKLLPELYIVPKEAIEAEKENPGSQKRVPNENIPLVWAQSLFLLSDMIQNDLLSPSDIDPLNRRKRIGHKRKTYPMVTFLSENEIVKQELLNLGFESETFEDLKPLKIMHASQLCEVQNLIGKNDKLGLTGRPSWVPRSITTARLHILAGEKIVFLPYYFNPKGFYFSHDNKFLVEQFKSSLIFLANHWDQAGQPILPFLIREDMLNDINRDKVLKLLNELQNGSLEGFEIKTAPLGQLLNTAAVERVQNLHGFELKSFEINSDNKTFYSASLLGCDVKSSEENLYLYNIKDENELQNLLNENISLNAKAHIIEILYSRFGFDYKILSEDKHIDLKSLAHYYYKNASNCHNWTVVRKMADILEIFDDRLEDSLLEVVIRQKRLAVGRAYSESATFSKPLESFNILKTIKESCGGNSAENVLTQEIILHIGHLIRIEPNLFENMITIRTWYLVQLLVSNISRENSVAIGDAYEYLLSLAPHAVYDSIRNILESFSNEVGMMKENENIQASGVDNIQNITTPHEKVEIEMDKDWAIWRKNIGMIGSTDSQFYKGVWYLLQQCNGLVIGDKYNQCNRMGSDLTLDTTAGERNFELRVDSLLQSIKASEYRQLNIEALQSLSRVFKENPEIKIDSDILIDVLIGHAVRLAWQKNHKNENYDEQKGQAWSAFYELSPKKTDEFFIESFMHLLTLKD